jgi:polysaccharide biosynthesis protein PslF
MSTIGFVSSYAPTLCGLATFTGSLYAELVTAGGASPRVVRVVDTPQGSSAPEVVAELVAGDPTSAMRSAAALNQCDVVIVQHEYGIYGGADGVEILPFLGALVAPVIVVFHTVLSSPTEHQRSVLEGVAALADAVVVMTTTARDRLTSLYDVPAAKVTVIPHGAPPVRASSAALFRTTQPTILTWGLIGPGKGIEWGIAAMALLRDLSPMPRYVIAGQTHPKVLLREGEAYRENLVRQVRDLGLSDSIVLDNHYRHAAALAELVSSADVVLLPYDSGDQVTSGVLIEAVAAGKPVVATRFAHAVELLSDGGGILVPHKDPVAIAGALREVLARRSSGFTPARATPADLLWPAVADRYLDVARRLIRAHVAA